MFSCPSFDGGEAFDAKFEHVKDLQNLEYAKPVKMASELNDDCLHPQPIEKTKVSLASRIFSESTRNAMRYYVNNGYPEWKGTITFLDIIAKWWNILNVKSPSKGKRKSNPDCEKISLDNYENVSDLFSKIVIWIDEWKLSGKLGLSDETFKTFKHTSIVMPRLVEYLLLDKGIDYILTGKIHSDFLEKRFGRYRQLNGANYFATERQFLEAGKSIRVKSLIKFSGYSIKEDQLLLKIDEGCNDAEIKLHAETIMDMTSEDIAIDVQPPDVDIIYYVAGFIARSLTKHFKCNGCSHFLGTNEEILLPTLKNVPADSESFLKLINRGGLMKPSYVTYAVCIGAWEMYKLIMDNKDSKTYFLACKSHRPVFINCVLVFMKASDRYNAMFELECASHHQFEKISTKVIEKFFNVMAKKLRIRNEFSNTFLDEKEAKRK